MGYDKTWDCYDVRRVSKRLADKCHPENVCALGVNAAKESGLCTGMWLIYDWNYVRRDLLLELITPEADRFGWSGRI